MSRIAKTFADLAERHRKALIPYICAAIRCRTPPVDVMLAMADAGADIIELGVRFRPDGRRPVIQKAPSARWPKASA